MYLISKIAFNLSCSTFSDTNLISFNSESNNDFEYKLKFIIKNKIVKKKLSLIVNSKYIIIYSIMDYNKDNIVKDKAETWKSFNKLTVYTIIFVAIILVIIFSLF